MPCIYCNHGYRLACTDLDACNRRMARQGIGPRPTPREAAGIRESLEEMAVSALSRGDAPLGVTVCGVNAFARGGDGNATKGPIR